MLIIQFITILVMFVGLMCTLAPKLHGSIIILVMASIYAMISGNSLFFQSSVVVYLLILAILAEVGVRWVRQLLTKNYNVSRLYSIDVTVCNLAGIIVISTLLKSIIGMTIWEAIIGKTLLPRLDSIGKILIRLFFTAILRFICGLIMIIIILKYVMV